MSSLYRGIAADKRKRIFAKSGLKCYYCARKATSVDHVIPRSKGGKDNLSNLVAACKFCNEVRNVMEAELYKRYVARFGRPKDISWKQSHNKYKMYAAIRIWKNNVGPIRFLQICKSRGFNNNVIRRAIRKIRKFENG